MNLIFVLNLISILVLTFDTLSANKNESIPVVIWHGMGDACCDPTSIGYVEKIIQRNMPAVVYIHSLLIGSNIAEDLLNTFFWNPNEQVRFACKLIARDEKLRHGFNAIGFSQGSQFLRAVAQRCPDPPMFNLISIGGQHQGVYGIPYCPGSYPKSCKYLQKFLHHGAYTKWSQMNIVQAAYWHDPMNEKKYIKKSTFLADINNEREMNYEYRNNLMKLKNLVLVGFEDDRMITPKESSWFGFYSPGQHKKITKMEDSILYQKDRIGLKYLNENGRLHIISVPGDHLNFTAKWFTKEIVKKYLI